jgi:hypothetical protein
VKQIATGIRRTFDKGPAGATMSVQLFAETPWGVMPSNRFVFALAMVAVVAIVGPLFLTARTTPQRTYGGANKDIGHSVQPTADNGYVGAGWTTSFGVPDDRALLNKPAAVGGKQWVRQLGRLNSWDGGSSV